MGLAYVAAHSTALPLIHLRHRHFTYVTAHSQTLTPLHLRHRSFYKPSLHHLHHRHFTWRPAHSQRDEKSVWQTSLLQQVTKFRSSYSFGQLLRILLRAVKLFSFSHIVSSDSSFNIHNALYFVKYPSRVHKTRPRDAGGPRAAD